MTIKTFWTDPYLTKLDTIVESTNRDIVRVRETIFYAFSGGQESDKGSIGGFMVLDAKKKGFDIEYTLPSDHTLQRGDQVQIEIDWAHRYGLMRHHFGAELILELVHQKAEQINKIGAHIGCKKARIDFIWPENISALFPELIAKAQALIHENIEITSDFFDVTNEKRFWQIDGFARVPCGGTHLKRTGEVGNLSLKRKNIGKGKERIEVYLDSSPNK